MNLTPILDPESRPRRCIVIALDGGRYDYLERFPTPNMHALAERGVAFRNAIASNGCAQTAPGFASIGTGVTTREHGVFSSMEWYDRRLGKIVYWYDASTNLARMDVPTAAQRIKAHYPQMLVSSISTKDRLAILMSGPTADVLAYSYREHVFQRRTRGSYEGPGVGADYYRFSERAGKQLPSYLQELQTPRHIPWRGPGFDHPQKDIADTAEIDRFTMDGALAILEHQRPDILFVGLVSTNIVGHLFPPDSPEMAYTVSLIDEQIGRLLDITRRLGILEETLFIVTSDHGMGQKVRGIDITTELEQRFGPTLVQNIAHCFDSPVGGLYLKVVNEDTLSTMLEAIRTVPHVKGAWWKDDPQAPWYIQRVAHPNSPDIIIMPDSSSVVLAPGAQMPAHNGHHGPPYPSDVSIIQIFAGPGIRSLGLVGQPLNMDSTELLTNEEVKDLPEHKDVAPLMLRLFGVGDS